MDDLRAVRIFLRVAKRESFAEAARQLGTTRATVTRAVAALEKTLGTQLLVRTTRRVALTAAGAAYAARIAPLIDEIDRATAEVQYGDETPSGRIRLTAPMSFGLRVLPDLLSDFQDAHPNIDVQAVLSDEFLDIIGAGYDLAVRVTTPPDDQSTIWRKLCPVERVLVTSRDSASVTVSEPAELSQDQLVGHSAAAWYEDWTLTNSEGDRLSLKAGRRLSANSGDLLGQMLHRNGGVALLPTFLVRDQIESGELVQILTDWTPPQLWLSLLYPPYDRMPPLVTTFSEFFERQVNENPRLNEILGPS